MTPPAVPSPKNAAQALAAQGLLLHGAGQLDPAEKYYVEALSLDPNNLDALHMMGVVRLQQDKAGDAIDFIGRAIRRNPNVAQMHINLGAALRRAGEPAKAAQAYRKASRLDPKAAEAHYNLGQALFDLQDFEGAIAAYRNSLAIDPSDPHALVNLGNVYKALSRYDEAMDAYESALALKPRFAPAHANISAVLRELGRFHAALACIETAVADDPTDAQNRMSLAASLLQLGELERGWPYYESRFDNPVERVARRAEPPPFWNGEDLAGKSILVWTEQGLGDEIFFMHMFADVVQRAGRCVLRCTRRMAPVFARSVPGIEVVTSEEAVRALEGLDYQVPIGSLGRHFRRSFSEIKPHTGYLRADPARTADLHAKYARDGRKVVGVSWRSKNDRIGVVKSAQLTAWEPILATPGITFVNLQYGDCVADLAAAKAALGVEILHDPAIDPLKDMDGFFAQVAAMDLIVSTSNTTVHAAGAQNVPVWVMLPYAKGALWYWFLKRSDSPWYPSARIFRQHTLDPMADWWPEPIAEVGAALKTWAKGSR